MMLQVCDLLLDFDFIGDYSKTIGWDSELWTFKHCKTMIDYGDF